MIAALLFAACDGDSNTGIETSVTLSSDSVDVMIGNTTTVTATVTNGNGAPLFVSRNNAVALVSGTGTITGVAPGSTYVVATVGSAHDSVRVVVKPFALAQDSVVVQVGGSTTVTAPGGALPVTFVSRNQNVAQVSSAGTITGVSTGVTFVVATAGNLSDSVRVRVTTPSGGSQPIAIPLLGTGVVAERYTAEVAANGNVAYTTTWGSRSGNRGDAIKIWDVAGNTPVLADSIILPGVGTVSDVQISDDGALLVVSTEGANTAQNMGLTIFSRANPTRPTQLSRFFSANTTAGIHTVKLGRVNGKLYAVGAGNNARMIIVDISNPAQPVEVNVTPVLGGSIHDVFVRDGIIFAGFWSAGMHVYDIGGAGRGGTPASPVFLGSIVTNTCKVCGAGARVHNIWWFHDPTTGQKKYAFVGEEGPGSVGSQISTGAIHVVDVTDYANMREVAAYEPDPATTANQQNAGAHNFVMDEPSGILYAAYYNAGVRALDVRGDLSSCTAAQKTADGRCDLLLMGREVGIGVSSGPPKYTWGVAMVGNRLYASDMWNGIFKLDISALKR
ncbi:MAG TPA: Ig-like domain-containing protein [Longimicrobiales bacterium]